MQLRGLVAAFAVLACALGAQGAGAITLGQVDTFASGTTAGWEAGAASPAPPQVVPGGGPAGSGDAYLLLTALGTGTAGSRLTVIAGPAWLGDYVTAGVTGIRFDANNLGSTVLELRVVLQGPALATAITSQGVTLQPGSGWTSVSLSLEPGALTGNPLALANVTGLRLFHSDSATFPGPAVVAQLGLDNITAVPEPGAAALFGGGLLLIAALAPALRRGAPCRASTRI